MKITREKNLAFADQPKPMTAEEVAKNVKPIAPKAKPPVMSLDLRINIPTEGRPKMDLAADVNQLPVMRLGNFRPGSYMFGPNMKTAEVKPLGNKSNTFAKALSTDGFLPDHLGLTLNPALPQADQIVSQRFRSLPDDRKYGNQATTIFPPENRMVFQDSNYPWGCCGRVDTANGQGSGVMVGPRHLLTVSHVIKWNADGTTGWLKFTPAYFNGAEPFGQGWGTLTYFKRKVDGPTIDFLEEMADYVCVVLDQPLGNMCGWMGAKGYTDAWDGGNYWSHIGYPGDLTGGARPTFQNNISMDGKWYEFDSAEAMDHRADVWPGQSGGPMFGWWNGQPYAVAVQSSQSSGQNDASGGQDMVDLIIRARAEHP